MPRLRPSGPGWKKSRVNRGSCASGSPRARLLGRAVHAECVAAVEGAAKLYQRLGHAVEEAAPTIESRAARQAFLVIASAETAAAIGEASRILRKKFDRRPPL
jgi:hypothetical protein